MTKENAYGVSADVAYDFDGWTWEDRSPGLVERISRDAAETLLRQMAKDATIWVMEDNIEFSFFDGEVTFTSSLREVFDKWLRTYGEEPEERSRMLALLEQTIATIRAHD